MNELCFIDANLGEMKLQEWHLDGLWLFKKHPAGQWVSFRKATLDDVWKVCQCRDVLIKVNLTNDPTTQVKRSTIVPAEHICPSCNGTKGKPHGKLVKWRKCIKCNGTGKRRLT